MILIFDLDETLYNENLFVKSGFKAVANFLEKKYKFKQVNTLKFLSKTYNKYGRKNIFDKLLRKKKIYNKYTLTKIIKVYRSHKPKISLNKSTYLFLMNLSKNFNLYLVTDGNKIVQKNKIKALKISNFFKKIYITHQYGVKYSKPSLFCFNKIKNLENCLWRDLVYIGDDPNKDFINLNKKGCTTIRIMKGKFKYTQVNKRQDGIYTINQLKDLLRLKKIFI